MKEVTAGGAMKRKLPVALPLACTENSTDPEDSLPAGPVAAVPT